MFQEVERVIFFRGFEHFAWIRYRRVFDMRGVYLDALLFISSPLWMCSAQTSVVSRPVHVFYGI